MATELGKIWVFDESKLVEAIEKYRQASIAAYPRHEEKISLTMLAIKDFLDSEYAEKLTMNVKVSDRQNDNE